MNYVLLLIAMLLQTQATDPDWAPPRNPDPSKILNEAEDDADAGRYKLALQKHVWYHKNALKHDPSHYGVRLSFALSSWTELGSNYEPALAKLRELRNESAKAVVAKQPARVAFGLFHEVAAIDESLGQTDKTVELFVKLDADHKALAKTVYRAAQPALLKEKKHELCGQYIDSKQEAEKIVLQFQAGVRMAKDPQFGDRMKQHVERRLTKDSASLVSILAINKRQEEVDTVVKKLKAVWENEEFHALLDEARKGKLPKTKASTAKAWSPPINPEPSKILREAEADARAGRHQLALQKHVWYHQNALDYSPSQYGVRLSFALSSWTELGAHYEPAIAKLRELRDESAKSLLTEQSAEVAKDLFHDVASINEVLGQDKKTAELFAKLDAENKPLAIKVYELAQPALLKEKKYELCGQYIDSKKEIRKIVSHFKADLRLAKRPDFGSDLKQFAESSLTQDSGSLVAILAINNRTKEVEEVVKTAKAVWENEKFHKVLDEARKGKFPVEKQ